ncbi:MAG: MFS transporter, partial [Sphingobium sp.]
PSFLTSRRPPDALDRLNALFRRMGRPEFDTLPPAEGVVARTGGRKGSFSLIPKPLWGLAALLCTASLFFTISGTFMASWKPQILGMSGLDMTMVGIAGMASSGAGVISHLAVGALARVVGELRIAIIFLAATIAALIIFGLVPAGATIPLIAAVAVWGFCNVGSYTALILVNLTQYDVGVRNAGLGLALGCGRIGGIVGPLFGGFAIGSGMGRFWALSIFALMLIPPIVALLTIAARKPGAGREGAA